MQTVWTAVILVTYITMLVFVAFRGRAAAEFAEFSLARRRMALALVFASLSAAYVGPGFAVGFVGKGFNSGFLFLAIGLAYAVQNILVGLWVAPRLRAFGDCHTLGDVMDRTYGRSCQVLTGIVSVGLCTGFSAVMAKAGGDIIAEVFGVPFGLGVVIMVGLTCLYTTFGGLRASVVTDAFQFVTFAILMPAMFLWILAFQVQGGLDGFVNKAMISSRTGWNATSTPQIAGLIVAFLLGETLIPPYAHRALASRTTRASRNSFLLAGGFSVLWFTIVVALGVAARGIVPAGTHEDSVLITLVKITMPLPCHALLLVVLMAIVMSSLDSLLNAGAVSFAKDLAGTLAGFSDRRSLRVGQLANVLIAITSVLAAAAVPGIIDGLLVCYSIWAPAILPALVLGLWLKRPRPLAGLLSMMAGSGAAIALQFIIPKAQVETLGVPTIVAALLVSLVAYAIGHWFTPSREEGPC